MWYGYDEAPLILYLVGVLMTAMLMMRLVPAASKDTAYRVLVQDGVGAIVTTTHHALEQLPFIQQNPN